MSGIDLNNRVFVPIENSEGGAVDARTEFHFHQDGHTFHATYAGGDIIRGHIIGQVTGPDTGHMLYHCLMKNHDLKAGRADALFTIAKDGRLGMALTWAWVSGAEGAGTSQYVEITDTGKHL